MKTNLLMALAFLALIGLSSGDAFAVQALTAGEETEVGETGTEASTYITLSKNVKGQYTGNMTSYSMGMHHQNGSRDYGTGSNTGVIWWTPCADPNACGTGETFDAGALSSQDFTAGAWTSL